MKKVLCVEDAHIIRLLVKTALKQCDITFAETIAEASTALENPPYSLVLLDLQLPDGTGMSVLEAMNRRADPTPVIMLTSEREFKYKQQAFSLGVEDFIEKPFSPAELEMRVHARIQKAEAQRTSYATLKQVGDLIMNTAELKLFQPFGEKVIDLTSLEFRIFAVLANKPNEVYTRETIITQIWGKNVSVTERTVDTHVAHLRKKIGATKVQIETVFGEGYRLKAS